MNLKLTYWLFGALVVLLVVASLSLLTGPKPGEEGRLLPDLKAKDVNRVVVQRKQPTEAKLVLVRTGEDKWKLDEPYTAHLDGRQVENLVNDLLNARTETKGADLTSNPAQFGLDDPSLVVTLETPGRSVTVNLGRVTIGSADKALVYVNTSESSRPAAVRRSSLSALLRDTQDASYAGELFKGVGEYRSKDLILEGATFNAAEVVRTIRLKGDKNEVVINKTSAGTWQYEKPAGFGEADLEGEPAGAGGDTTPTGVRPLLSAIAALRASSADDFIEGVTDFKQYGLEPGKAAGSTIEVVRNSPAGGDAPPVTETLTIGKKEDKGDRVYVRPDNEEVVVKVPESLVAPIRKVIEKPGSLRSRSLLNVTAGVVDGLDIQVGSDAPIELRRLAEPPGWRLFGPDGQSQNANAQSVQSLLNDLTARRLVKEFPDPSASDAALGFDKPTATLTLWADGVIPEKKDEKKEEKKEEPKKAEDKGKAAPKAEAKKEEPKGPAKPKMKEPTAKLVFGKRDKDLLYVRRLAGGSKTDLAVPESLLGKVTRGRLEYIDPTLPSFTVDKAIKLTLLRGGETFVIERQQKDDKSPVTWVIQQPSQFAGRHADRSKVDRLLGELAGLRAERLWAEKATDRELERFGLKPPKAQATITLKDDKDKERVYLFGAETDDKAQVYAKQGERDLVFSVRKGVLEDLQQTDLVDPTIFTLDLAKVTGMKLTGWKDVVGQETTLDLARKGANNWSVKSPAGYKLSASQAESFLGLLQTVRAEKFVAYKTGPKPEYKLTPAAGALLVELTIDGEKEPTTLALGAEAEGGKSYYAQSNKAPGDVFLLPRATFEKFKAKPGVFAAE